MQIWRVWPYGLAYGLTSLKRYVNLNQIHKNARF
nr:MAG TPA: hypothetical protein [Caudoviricetes sp.]